MKGIRFALLVVGIALSTTACTVDPLMGPGHRPTHDYALSEAECRFHNGTFVGDWCWVSRSRG